MFAGGANQAVQGFTSAMNDGRLQSQMLTLSSLSISGVSYSEQPIITATPANTDAVSAPASGAHSKAPSKLIVINSDCFDVITLTGPKAFCMETAAAAC